MLADLNLGKASYHKWFIKVLYVQVTVNLFMFKRKTTIGKKLLKNA